MSRSLYIKITITILFFSLSTFFCSCTKTIKTDILLSTNGKIINIDLSKHMKYEGFYWEDILDSVNILFPETNELSLIGEISNVVFSDDRIFIQDMVNGGSVIIFDTNGAFIKRLPKGNGPGEINRVVGISYDKWTNELLVIQNPIVQRFSANGDYIDDYKLPFPIDQLIVKESEFVFSKIKGHECKTIDSYNDYSIITTDRNLNISKMMLPYASERSAIFMVEKGDSLAVAMSGNDTIYHYYNDSLRITYVLKIPNKANISNMNFESMVKFLQTTKPFTECFFGNYLETDRHQYIEFEYGTYPYTLFRDKKNGNIGGGLSILIDDGHKNLFAIKQPIASYKDWFITVDNPYDYQKGKIISNQFIRKKDLEKLEALNDDDNPFFVMYKLKPFE